METNGLFQFFLYVAPVMGPVIHTVYNLLGEDEVPPLLLQFIVYSVGQTLVVLAAILVAGREVPIQARLILPWLISILFLLILVHAVIYRFQKANTIEHVSSVLQEIKFTEGIDIDLLRDTALLLVTVDFYPSSITNQLSRGLLGKKREKLAKLINMLSEDNPNLNENSFIVPYSKRRRLYIASLIVSGISVFVYLVSIWLTTLQ